MQALYVGIIIYQPKIIQVHGFRKYHILKEFYINSSIKYKRHYKCLIHKDIYDESYLHFILDSKIDICIRRKLFYFYLSK